MSDILSYLLSAGQNPQVCEFLSREAANRNKGEAS